MAFANLKTHGDPNFEHSIKTQNAAEQMLGQSDLDPTPPNMKQMVLNMSHGNLEPLNVPHGHATTVVNIDCRIAKEHASYYPSRHQIDGSHE